MSAPYTWSPAFLAYCDDALLLLDLRLTGQESSEEAERLRDHMTELWDDLTAAEEEYAGWVLADLNWIVRDGPPPRLPKNLPSEEERLASFEAAIERHDDIEVGRFYRLLGVQDTTDYQNFVGNLWSALVVPQVGLRLLRAALSKSDAPEHWRDLLTALDTANDVTLAAEAQRILEDQRCHETWWYAALALRNAATLGQLQKHEVITILKAKQQASPGVALMLGLFLYEDGQNKAALTSLRHALRKIQEPDEPALALLMSQAHTILARDHIVQRDYKEALKQLQKAVKLLPTKYPIPAAITFEQLKLRIIALAQLGRVAEAQKIAVRAMELLLEHHAPQEYEALYQLNAQLKASIRDKTRPDLPLPAPIPLLKLEDLRPPLPFPTLAA